MMFIVSNIRQIYAFCMHECKQPQEQDTVRLIIAGLMCCSVSVERKTVHCGLQMFCINNCQEMVVNNPRMDRIRNEYKVGSLGVPNVRYTI